MVENITIFQYYNITDGGSTVVLVDWVGWGEVQSTLNGANDTMCSILKKAQYLSNGYSEKSIWQDISIVTL